MLLFFVSGIERGRRHIRRNLVVEHLEERTVPALLGQQLFPADYPWNQNISNAPVASNSAAIISQIGSSTTIHPDWGDDNPSNGNSPLYGIPVNIVHGNSTAPINVEIDNYPSESDIVPVPVPANAVIEGDYQNGPNLNGGGYNAGQRGDSHLIVWDEDNNIAYELFGVTRPNDPTLFPNNNNVELPHTDGLWHAAQESVWNMNTDQFRSLGETSADAAGLSILAGLARPDEGLPVNQGGQGAIDHAIRMTLPAGDIAPQYIYPASHVVGDAPGANEVPFGTRFRLVNTTAVNKLIAGMGPEAQVIAHAMQQYGLMVADIGSTFYFQGTSASENSSGQISLAWNMDDVLGLEKLTVADFQVVNLTPIVTGLSTRFGAAGASVTINGQNFSGAAGRLSVLFGTVASKSVTVVSDSEITALVPSGSGTVDVRVQSGIKKTDPNNADDNVNHPIFGYGTSATSSADQFTYGAAPVFTTLDQRLVNQLYLDLLGRQADASGLSTWGGALDAGSSTRAQVAAAVVASSEYRTDEIDSAYEIIFDQQPDAAEQASALSFLGGSVLLQLEAQLYGSSSFFEANGSTNTGFLTGLYKDVLGRGLDAGGKQTWLAALTAGESRTAVAAAIISSTESEDYLVHAAFQQFLHRAADPAGLSSFVSQLQGGASIESVVVSLTGSAEYALNAKADANVAYVTQLYSDLLDRAADPGSLAALSNGLDSATLTRSQVLGLILGSAEYQNDVVQVLYKRYLNRAADAMGLASFSAELAGGASDETVAAALIGSGEFFADNGATNAGFINGIYQDSLDRAPTSAELAAGETELQNGTSHSQLAASIFATSEYETDVIQAAYQQLLHRAADNAGLTSMLALLKSGAHDEAVLAMLAESVEYFQRLS